MQDVITEHYYGDSVAKTEVIQEEQFSNLAPFCQDLSLLRD